MAALRIEVLRSLWRLQTEGEHFAGVVRVIHDIVHWDGFFLPTNAIPIDAREKWMRH